MLERTKMTFQMPWIKELLSHFMYQERGYLSRISLAIELTGKSKAAPTATAKDPVHKAKDI